MKARLDVTVSFFKERVAHPWPWKIYADALTRRSRLYGRDDYLTRLSKPSRFAVTRALIRNFG